MQLIVKQKIQNLHCPIFPLNCEVCLLLYERSAAFAKCFLVLGYPAIGCIAPLGINPLLRGRYGCCITISLRIQSCQRAEMMSLTRR